MAEVIFVTGGARSGKSRFATKLAKQKTRTPVYLATARVWDDDFKFRIQKHRDDRGSEWLTIEEEVDIDTLNLDGKVVVVDCITLWLTNIFHNNNYDEDKSLIQAKRIWNGIVEKDCTLIVVTNELGMGIHASDQVSRKFTDLQGFMNQYVALLASEVFFMVSGIPTKIK